uniref:Transposable element Tc3 transposase n=1 Tax=Anoplophora glabripennis TaxID=217634 RepID=V5GAN1_ANOGL
MDNLPLAEHSLIFYQHDGAPPHNSHLVNDLLQEGFHDHWIANNGPFIWPPRSPDLSVLDYFIWGTIKNEVYNTPPTAIEDCMERVRNAFNKLNVNSIRRVMS